MDKKQIITFIEEQIASGKISREDIQALGGVDITSHAQVSSTTSGQSVDSNENSKKLTHTFYGIGAIIAVVGVVILVAQNWNEIGFLGRIIVTLGISLSAYILALIVRSPEQKSLSQVLFGVSAILAPLGVYVLLKEAGMSFSLYSQIVTSVILFSIFTTALYVNKQSILVIIASAYATWTYYATLIKVVSPYYDDADLFKFATMVIGVAYIYVGYGHKMLWQSKDVQDEKEKALVQNFLYGVGTVAILTAGIFIGGLFDVFFIALIFGAFYGSVYLKSRSMLSAGSFFLMAHIIKLTSEYFVDSIGWPIALIGVGFLLIGVGYATVYLNKKFISA